MEVTNVSFSVNKAVAIDKYCSDNNIPINDIIEAHCENADIYSGIEFEFSINAPREYGISTYYLNKKEEADFYNKVTKCLDKVYAKTGHYVNFRITSSVCTSKALLNGKYTNTGIGYVYVFNTVVASDMIRTEIGVIAQIASALAEMAGQDSVDIIIK